MCRDGAVAHDLRRGVVPGQERPGAHDQLNLDGHRVGRGLPCNSGHEGVCHHLALAALVTRRPRHIGRGDQRRMRRNGFGHRQQRREMGHRVRRRAQGHPPVRLRPCGTRHHRGRIDPVGNRPHTPRQLAIPEHPHRLSRVTHDLRIDERALPTRQRRGLPHDDLRPPLAQLPRLQRRQGVRHLPCQRQRQAHVRCSLHRRLTPRQRHLRHHSRHAGRPPTSHPSLGRRGRPRTGAVGLLLVAVGEHGRSSLAPRRSPPVEVPGVRALAAPLPPLLRHHKGSLSTSAEPRTGPTTRYARVQIPSPIVDR